MYARCAAISINGGGENYTWMQWCQQAIQAGDMADQNVCNARLWPTTSIAKAEFFAGAALVSTASAPSYTGNWGPSGQTAMQTINVSSDGVSPPITISADQSEGVQSLTVTFTASGEGAYVSNIGVTGGGVTFTQNGDAMVANYSAPGAYPTQLTATDASGNIVEPIGAAFPRIDLCKSWCAAACLGCFR